MLVKTSQTLTVTLCAIKRVACILHIFFLPSVLLAGGFKPPANIIEFQETRKKDTQTIENKIANYPRSLFVKVFPDKGPMVQLLMTLSTPDEKTGMSIAEFETMHADGRFHPGKPLETVKAERDAYDKLEPIQLSQTERDSYLASFDTPARFEDGLIEARDSNGKHIFGHRLMRFENDWSLVQVFAFAGIPRHIAQPHYALVRAGSTKSASSSWSKDLFPHELASRESKDNIDEEGVRFDNYLRKAPLVAGHPFYPMRGQFGFFYAPLRGQIGVVKILHIQESADKGLIVTAHQFLPDGTFAKPIEFKYFPDATHQPAELEPLRWYRLEAKNNLSPDISEPKEIREGHVWPVFKLYEEGSNKTLRPITSVLKGKTKRVFIRIAAQKDGSFIVVKWHPDAKGYEPMPIINFEDYWGRTPAPKASEEKNETGRVPAPAPTPTPASSSSSSDELIYRH
jgi:hypothetical protein